jgi:hypothetical protein
MATAMRGCRQCRTSTVLVMYGLSCMRLSCVLSAQRQTVGICVLVAPLYCRECLQYCCVDNGHLVHAMQHRGLSDARLTACYVHSCCRF